MRRHIIDALGKAAVAYPFLVFVLVIVVTIEATDGHSPGDFAGWLMWSLLWVGIAAFVSAFVIVPILAVEFLVWGFIARRFRGLDDNRVGLIVSSVLMAIPWALAPQARGWGSAVLVGFALLVARLAVPSLGIDAFNTEADA